MTSKEVNGSPPTLEFMIVQHIIVFLICVVFPCIVTWNSPSTWINYNRSEDGVRCTAMTCVFFVVPYKIQQANRITEIDSSELPGKTVKSRGLSRRVEGKGFLLIHGDDDQLVEVIVSRSSLNSILEKSKAFLNSRAEKSTTMFVVANWEFGVMWGGLLSSFTAMYVFVFTLIFLNWILVGRKKP